MERIISEGAEAKLILINSNIIKKKRCKKPYRLEIIDKKLRKSRTKREFKILKLLFENGIKVPEPFEINLDDFSFTFQYINSVTLKQILNKELLFKAFNEIIKIHKNNIIHGDLTSLNILVYNNETYIIDFGLSEFSNKIEDKAVDLNLFFNCIKNEHPEYIKYKNELLNLYKKEKFGLDVIKRLENIEKRGRNK